MKILAIHLTSTAHQSEKNNWATETGKICTGARDTYSRDHCLANRILYLNNFLLAQAWYTAQIFPIPGDCIRQIITAIAWFLWQGSIFQVPLSTLQQRKQQRGWGLTNVAAKIRTLLFYRLQLQGQEMGTLTADWLRRWHLLTPSTNPPTST
jgi:hypothetical protein